MAEVRRVYRVSGSSVSPVELNFLLSQIADRLDQLEGYRGQGDFKVVPKSQLPASRSDELVQLAQIITVDVVDSRINTALGQTITTITVNAVRVIDPSDGVTLIHSFAAQE